MDITPNNVDQQHDSILHYEALQEMGDCYASVGNYKQAQKYYEKAAVLAPDAPDLA
jgi:tetratricopeptide (TPR) repeat protein